MPRAVYLNEYNVLMGMGDATYLPLATGILRANAEADAVLKAAYKLKPFLFRPNQPESIFAQYDEEPSVAAFSVSMWNERLSLAVARRVKERWPDCLIVFGGPQCPHNPKEYTTEHRFIDVTVRAEGEEAFAEILRRNLTGRNFADIPNVSYRDSSTGEFRTNLVSPEYIRDLDLYPSPYLTGIYDYLFDGSPGAHNLQAIIETNRGCPFLCTFCYWGRGGSTRKYRFHSLARVKDEIDWVGDHSIPYLFNADSNFGMHRRDEQIAEMLADTKQRIGFPEKFRTCWGKNTSERIFKIGAFLHEHELEKGITLARQSNNEDVLHNIKRDNIRLDAFTVLQKRFNDLNVPIYAEMILGLPGETYESWKSGIEDLLSAGLKNQLFVYQAEVYPNTELGDPAYQDQFEIVTRRIELMEIHGKVRDTQWIREYQDIIVKTASMPNEDWRRMTVLSVVTMLMHSMKLGFFVMAYLADRYGTQYVDFVEHLVESGSDGASKTIISREVAALFDYTSALMEGKGRGIHLADYGDIYWDAEEASFLRISENLQTFYAEMEEELHRFLRVRGIDSDVEELHEIVAYQAMRIPQHTLPETSERMFERNIPEYFETHFGTKPVAMEKSQQKLICCPIDFAADRSRFARETILWGRKSGTMLVPVDPRTVYVTPAEAADRDAEAVGNLPLFDKQSKFEGFRAKLID